MPSSDQTFFGRCLPLLLHILCYVYIKEDCPWLTPTNGSLPVLECNDGSMCDVLLQGWACCSERGGRAKCPAFSPFMCGDPNSGVGGTDHSCEPEESLCESKGGIRKCGEFVSCDWSKSSFNQAHVRLLMTLSVLVCYRYYDWCHCSHQGS